MNFAILDWEDDPILANPTRLDLRVDQMLAEGGLESDDDSFEGQLVIDENPSPSFTSTSSAVSNITPTSDTPSSQSSKEPDTTAHVSLVQVPSEINPTNSSKKIKPAILRRKRPLQSDSLASTRLQAAPSVMNNLMPTSWETPAQKIQKYERRRDRCKVHKQVYMERFKTMKNTFRKVKITDDALPPPVEVIKLFDEVRYS